MLHILLLILKIIGIILAVILGILVLLICIVLFVPVRYKGTIHCDGSIESFRADGRVTWLFPLVVIVAQYKEKQFRYSARIAWKHIADKTEPVFSEELPLAAPCEKKPVKPIKVSLEQSKPTESDTEKTSYNPGKTKEKTQQNKKKTSRNIVNDWIKRWKQMWKKMKCTITSFCAKIKVLLQKKETMLEFIYDETHQNAFQKAKLVLFILLKRWRPKKVRADFVFGFEDPYYTGQVLAGLGVIYPFVGKETSITPDFEQAIFKGTIDIKGKLAMIHAVSLCWKLFWCKAVRRTYKDVKNFKL